MIGLQQERLGCHAVPGTGGDANADRKPRLFVIGRQPTSDSIGELLAARFRRLAQDYGELVSAEARSGVGGPAAGPETIGHSAERPIAHEVPMKVIDLLHAVHVQQKQDERPVESL